MLLAHSASPLLLYLITIPSYVEYGPAFVRVSSPTVILLLKLPPMIYPPSLVPATDLIELFLPMLVAHSASPSLLYLIIIPAEYSPPLFVRVSSPTVILLLLKAPPTIYPPSLISVTELIVSSSPPPILLAHSTSPILLYLITIPSEPHDIVLLFVRVSSPTVILSLSKYPPTIYPPSLVPATE